MLDAAVFVYNTFRNEGLDEPLLETLRFIDLVSGGALSAAGVPGILAGYPELADIARQRSEGIPMEYAVGSARFCGLCFRCTKDTFIPTDHTRHLLEAAVECITERQESEPRQTVIDVATGCGNIAVLLAMKTSGTRIIASDISPAALEVSRSNIRAYHLESRIHIVCGDLLEPFKDPSYYNGIDVIVCNPPYIPRPMMNKLPEDTVTHQPRLALDGGAFGIDVIRRLIVDAVPLLKPGGELLFEAGENQVRLAERVFSGAGAYDDIQCCRNEGSVRVVRARKHNKRE